MKTPEEMAKEYIEQEQLEYDEAGGAYYGFLAGYQAAKVETNLPTSAKWISVKNRLPKKNILILCCSLKSLSPTYGWFDGTFWNVNDEPNYFKDKIDCISFITHWMPLPAPPKEEK